MLVLRDLGRAGEHPSALVYIVGGKLRELREDADLSPKQVRAAVGILPAKLSKIETGKSRCSLTDARALLDLYRVHDPVHVAQFLEVAEHALRPPHWKACSVPAFFAPLVSLEFAAEQLRIFEPFYVPGLLQTRAYATAVIRAEWPNRTTAEVRKVVKLREARQAQYQRMLDSGQAPHLWVIVRSEALLHSIGDKAVLRDQLEHLLRRLRTTPDITFQVAPASAMGKVPIPHNLTHLRFNRAELADAVYIEQTTDAAFHTDRATVEHHLSQLNRLAPVILTPEESVAFIEECLDELSG
ncbi:helix-turn-helix transcriptional regulator [Streptomyces xanthochromogenes]|uniref:helix-turn-helix domain-containing protein n=1 Tax=Streptomyces xanthochromogenes TaxID=67384 RepID=UPI0034393C43